MNILAGGGKFYKRNFNGLYTTSKWKMYFKNLPKPLTVFRLKFEGILHLWTDSRTLYGSVTWNEAEWLPRTADKTKRTQWVHNTWCKLRQPFWVPRIILRNVTTMLALFSPCFYRQNVPLILCDCKDKYRRAEPSFVDCIPNIPAHSNIHLSNWKK